MLARRRALRGELRQSDCVCVACLLKTLRPAAQRRSRSPELTFLTCLIRIAIRNQRQCHILYEAVTRNSRQSNFRRDSDWQQTELSIGANVIQIIKPGFLIKAVLGEQLAISSLRHSNSPSRAMIERAGPEFSALIRTLGIESS